MGIHCEGGMVGTLTEGKMVAEQGRCCEGPVR